MESEAWNFKVDGWPLECNGLVWSPDGRLLITSEMKITILSPFGHPDTVQDLPPLHIYRQIPIVPQINQNTRSDEHVPQLQHPMTLNERIGTHNPACIPRSEHALITEYGTFRRIACGPIGSGPKGSSAVLTLNSRHRVALYHFPHSDDLAMYYNEIQIVSELLYEHVQGDGILSQSSDKNLATWNVAWSENIEDSTISLIALVGEGLISIWKYKNGAVAKNPSSVQIHTGCRITSVVFGPLGKIVACASTDGTVIVFDIVCQAEEYILKERKRILQPFCTISTLLVTHVDGPVLFATNQDVYTLSLDAFTSQAIRIAQYTSVISSMAFNDRDQYLYTSLYDGAIMGMYLNGTETASTICNDPDTNTENAIFAIALSPNVVACAVATIQTFSSPKTKSYEQNASYYQNIEIYSTTTTPSGSLFQSSVTTVGDARNTSVVLDLSLLLELTRCQYAKTSPMIWDLLFLAYTFVRRELSENEAMGNELISPSVLQHICCQLVEKYQETIKEGHDLPPPIPLHLCILLHHNALSSRGDALETSNAVCNIAQSKLLCWTFRALECLQYLMSLGQTTTLSDAEKVTATIMMDIVQFATCTYKLKNHQDLVDYIAPLCAIARVETNVITNIPSREVCPICTSSNIDWHRNECDNGHVFKRCIFTFQIIGAGDSRDCPGCGAHWDATLNTKAFFGQNNDSWRCCLCGTDNFP